MKVPVFGPVSAATFHAIAGPVIVVEGAHRCVENRCVWVRSQKIKTAKRKSVKLYQMAHVLTVKILCNKQIIHQLTGKVCALREIIIRSASRPAFGHAW